MAADAEHPSLLVRILWDSGGRHISPSHANKNGARYRYYISRKDQERLSLPIHRVLAGEIENLVTHQLCHYTDASRDTSLPAREVILDHIDEVTFDPDCIEIRLPGPKSRSRSRPR